MLYHTDYTRISLYSDTFNILSDPPSKNFEFIFQNSVPSNPCSFTHLFVYSFSLFTRYGENPLYLSPEPYFRIYILSYVIPVVAFYVPTYSCIPYSSPTKSLNSHTIIMKIQ